MIAMMKHDWSTDERYTCAASENEKSLEGRQARSYELGDSR